MPDELKYIYWDSDVILSYVNGIQERCVHLDVFLEESGDGHQLITSTLSIVEVAFAKAEQDGKVLDTKTETRINKLWMAGSPIKLIEYYTLIGNEAKNLMREALIRGWKLKPMDATHLATAKNLHATEFHTYDKQLEKYGPLCGFRVCPPVSDHPKLL